MAATGLRRTKIVATIGPASDDHDTLRALADAGMDGARLNFSHGTHEDMARRTELVRDVQEEIGRPIALIADLQGPKLRIGELAGARRPRTRRATSRSSAASTSSTARCPSAPP